MRRSLLCCIAMAAVLLPSLASAQRLGDMTDEEIRAHVLEINERLEAAGIEIQVSQIEFFTFGQGRPPVKIHQQPFRWVAGDPRRAAQGDDITYMLDDTNNAGPTSLGFYPTDALRSALTSWDEEKCLSKVNVVERPSLPGVDVTVFDGELGGFCPGADLPGNGLANFVAADIINAGWYPASCFGFNTLAFSVTFTFTGTDINGDNYLDTALNEVYFNDAWGNPATPDGRANFPWNIGGLPIPNIDVETVGLHENGHSLGLGHFNGPVAVMNASYAGPRVDPLPVDHAGMCAVYGSWPQ